MKNIYNVIPKINVGLIISGFLLGGYLLYSMSRPYHGTLGDKQLNLQSFESVVKKTLDAVPPYNKGIFKNSELFSSLGKKGVTQQARNLVLLGVSMGEKKLAVIRDTKANKDYYCTEDDIAGEYRIKEIYKDKVILEYDGSILEITR
jgi:type II secretory pathway component PulC